MESKHVKEQDPVLTPEEQKLVADWVKKNNALIEEWQNRQHKLSVHYTTKPNQEALRALDRELKALDNSHKAEDESYFKAWQKTELQIKKDLERGVINEETSKRLQEENKKRYASQLEKSDERYIEQKLNAGTTQQNDTMKPKDKKRLEKYKKDLNENDAWYDQAFEANTTPQIKGLIRKQLNALLPELNEAGLGEQIGNKDGQATVDEVITVLNRIYKADDIKHLFHVDLDENGLITTDEINQRLRVMYSGDIKLRVKSQSPQK